MKRFVVLGALVAALAAGTAPVASATDMSCEIGHCWWGYNYVGSGLNEIVVSGPNYWVYEYIDKNSGGTVYYGFGGNPPCYTSMSGGGQDVVTPGDFGCGGYRTAFTQYASGATSYLFIEAYA